MSKLIVIIIYNQIRKIIILLQFRIILFTGEEGSEDVSLSRTSSGKVTTISNTFPATAGNSTYYKCIASVV